MIPQWRDRHIVALLAAAVAFLFLDVIFFGNGFYFRDITQSYIPWSEIVRRIIAGGEFPHWQRFLSAGQPLAPNPQYQLFYPGTWLIFLPWFPWGLQLEIVLHLALLTCSTFALLRELRCSRAAAIFGAISLGIGGAALSLSSLLPSLTTFAWWPLVVLLVRRVVRYRRTGDACALAATFAMIFLAAELGMILQAAMLVVATIASTARTADAKRWLLPLAAATTLALAIASVQLVPAWDLKRDTSRDAALDYGAITAWSMPPVRVLELFYPHLLGRITDDGREFRGADLYDPPRMPWLLSLYGGMLVSAFALTGFVLRARGWKAAATLTILSYAMAVGGNGFLAPLFARLPLLSAIRYPERYILAGIFALTIFAALTFDEIVANARARSIAVAICGLAFLGAVVGAAISTDRSLWIDALIRTALALVVVFLVGRGAVVRYAAVLLILFATADVGTRMRELAPRMPRQFFEPPPVASALPRALSAGRIMQEINWPLDGRRQLDLGRGDASYWLMRNTLMPLTGASWGLQSIFDPDVTMTSLKPTADFLQVVWESGAHGMPSWPRPFLGMSNVSDRILPNQRMQPGDYETTSPLFIEPVKTRPRYWFARQVFTSRGREEFVQWLRKQSWPEETVFAETASFQSAGGDVLSVDERSNSARIDVEARDRAFLFMSVTPHRYWRATIDGRDAALIVANVGFQGMIVPPGRHTVEMHYSNPLTRLFGVVSILATLALITAWIALVYRGRPRRPLSSEP